MAKVKMVKCMLRSPGEAPTIRFVPLREYNLWKYYMIHAHEKIVEGEEISFWIDAQSYSEQPPAQARPLESVVRIDLQYWDRGMNTAAATQRYFPLDDYRVLRDVFLRHYPDVEPPSQPTAKKKVSETPGYYVHPRLPYVPEV